MKRLLTTTAFTLLLANLSFSQVNEGLIELGKAYRQFMFRNNPPIEFIKDLEKYDNSELAFAAKFIRETIKGKNSILTDEFLKRPSDKDMKYIYIIRLINYNIREDKPRDNNELIGEVMSKDILVQEMTDAYYSMLITAYGNKVDPFDMSNVNFNLNSYNLKDDTEKGIFFLQIMRLCGSEIWGYMNVVKPPNYTLALTYISKYPKFNSLPYYQFLDLNFPDFKIRIESPGKTQSYKEYYIDKYYETLLNHLDCLNETNADKEKIYDLLLGSLLKEENFYKYSKSEKLLKKIFKKYKE